MTSHDHQPRPFRAHCCPCGCHDPGESDGVDRRDFLKAGGLGLGGMALAGLTWSTLAAAESDPDAPAPPRQTLVVKPVFMYDIPQRQPQTSWRGWGGVQTQADADQEAAHIKQELDKIQAEADFPVKFLPLLPVRGAGQLKGDDLATADAFIVYASGGWKDVFTAVAKFGKPMIIFVRHKSGPVSLWYEIVSPHYLHACTDQLAVKGADNGDVVVDSQEEIVWRLRGLCGLKNVMGAKIVAIGGPGGWATPHAPKYAQEKFKLDIQTVTYEDLGGLIKQAKADNAAVGTAKRRAAKYLDDAGVKLETKKEFVENCFLLEQVFRGIMAKAGTRMMTINACMSTIMPMSETTACLTLSLLNDAGFPAFCESDFVVVPAGILLHGISGRPQFLNDPTYPHDGVITLAHCTGPRRNDGKTLDPVRLVTHFESDYGAAPKVEMKKGQKVTNIIPSFKADRWTGFVGEIVDAPFLPICRCQIDVSYKFPDARLAENMPGFHWMTCYGDYVRELGYALKRVPIAWENLG